MTKAFRNTCFLIMLSCSQLSITLYASNCPVCEKCDFINSTCQKKPALQQMLYSLVALHLEFPSPHHPHQQGDGIYWMDMPHDEQSLYTEAMFIGLTNQHPIIPGVTNNYYLYLSVMEEYSEIFQQLKDNDFWASIEIQKFTTDWQRSKEQGKRFNPGTTDYKQHWEQMYSKGKSQLSSNYRLVTYVSEALSRLEEHDKAIMLMRIFEQILTNMTMDFKLVFQKKLAIIMNKAGYYYQALSLYQRIYSDGSKIYPVDYAVIQRCFTKLSTTEKQTVIAWFNTLSPNDQGNNSVPEYSYVN